MSPPPFLTKHLCFSASSPQRALPGGFRERRRKRKSFWRAVFQINQPWVETPALRPRLGMEQARLKSLRLWGRGLEWSKLGSRACDSQAEARNGASQAQEPATPRPRLGMEPARLKNLHFKVFSEPQNLVRCWSSTWRDIQRISEDKEALLSTSRGASLVEFMCNLAMLLSFPSVFNF